MFQSLFERFKVFQSGCGLVIMAATFLEIQTGSVPAPFVRTQFQEDISVEGPRLDFPPDHSKGIVPI